MTLASKQKRLHSVSFLELNAYAFACGYVQFAETSDETRRVTLTQEHGVYHVIYVDTERPSEENSSLPRFYRNWQTFSKLTDARKCFASHLKTIGESK